jgi:hypothetical protein
MTGNRAIITTVALLASMVSAGPAASANPLLSGYGGPGEGNQAILGSTLLDGPSQGGGGSVGSAGAAGSGGLASAGADAGLAAAAPAHLSSSVAHHDRTAADGSGTASGEGSQTRIAGSGSPVSQATVVGAQTLGLSADDVLYMLLALGALAITGVLTRRLARPPE